MILVERKTRKGRKVYLDRGAMEGDPEFPYTTVCENHGGCVSHRTRADAMSWLSHPEAWCPGCQDEERAQDDE